MKKENIAEFLKIFLRKITAVIGYFSAFLPKSSRIVITKISKYFLDHVYHKIHFLVFEIVDELISCLFKNEFDPVLFIKKVGKGVLELDIRKKTQRQIYLSEPYEPGISNFFQRNIKPNMNFLDVGANIGYYSIMVAGLIGPEGRVISFEPENQNFERLKQHVSINGYGNVQIVKKALGDQSSKGVLHINPYNEGGHSVYKRWDEEHDATSQEILIESFDKLRKDDGDFIGKIDFVKIDIEGFELEALQGMKDMLVSEQPIVVCEVSRRPKDLFDFMHSLNFLSYTLDNDGGILPCTNYLAGGPSNYLFKM